MASDASAPKDPGQANQRLISLDALRGFDMWWIMGGQHIAHAGAKLTGWAWLVWLSGQLEHPEWNGFAFYDLIFPLFLFLAGVSMPFSFEKRFARGDSKQSLYRHIIIRALVLVVLGMVYNGLLKFDWSSTRLPSVLGRIGLATLFAALIVLNSSVRTQLLWVAGILVGYWAALTFIPVPGLGAGDLTPGHTLADYIDRLLIPGRLYEGDRDPEGLLATIPAIATALAGAVTGQFLKRDSVSALLKAVAMVVVGFVCLGLASLWNPYFPINKNLWTSSFMLLCTGWSLVLFALFYVLIDVWKCRRWAYPFVVIGMNSILIYMTPKFVDFKYTTEAVFGGVLKGTGAYQAVLSTTAFVFVNWLFLLFLYKKRVFLRV